MKRAWLLRTAVSSLLAAGFLAAGSVAMADAMSDLIEAAKKEGELTIIAVPHDWCKYGDRALQEEVSVLEAE
jgi:putative spermidine/putrescine transport system substrate-binding protein